MAGPTTWGVQVLGFGAGTTPGVADTTKIKVRLAVFDVSDCSCTATGNYEIWEDGPMTNPSAAGLDPSVNDWISGSTASMAGGTVCAQVVSLNETGTAGSNYTIGAYSDCADCNSSTLQCEPSTSRLIQVRIAEFSSDGECTCSLSSTYEIWEDDSMTNPSAGSLDPSVDDWISGSAASMAGGTVCAKVTAIDPGGTAVGYTLNAYSDCADCNDNNWICFGGGP